MDDKKICKKHNIEMNIEYMSVPEMDENGIPLYDKNGIPIYSEMEMLVCPICSEEEELKNASEFYSEKSYFEGTNIVKENIKKIEEKNPDQKNLNEKEKEGENFIEKYTPFIEKITDAPHEACKAMAQFLISCALSKAKYENSKGRILSNLSFIWIAPSGSNKTPLIENTIAKLLPDVFPHFSEFGVVTGKGFRKEVSTWDNKIPIRPLVIIWDEMSTMAKDAKHDGTSDLYEVLSEAFDGKLTPYTSVRGGHERYPHLYSNMWITGVPSFLENTDKSFWYQGFGLRSLFLKYEIPEIKDISDDAMDEIKDIYENLKTDLNLMKDISFVATTPAFMEKYNDFWKSTIKEIQEIQKDILKTEDPDVFPIISKVKYPVLIMKLAMVNATARYNFTDKGILKLDVEDFESAKNDLESYHKNMVDMFSVWEELVENKSRINNIKNLKDKIKRHINSIIFNGKSFEYRGLDQNGYGIFEMKKDGKWVSHSALLRLSHLTSKDFNELITTLVEENLLSKMQGIVNGNIVVFYSIKML